MDGGGEGLKQIAQILAERETELQHMMKILQKDMKDLNVVFGKSTANITLEGGVNSWGSTSTLSLNDRSVHF